MASHLGRFYSSNLNALRVQIATVRTKLGTYVYSIYHMRPRTTTTVSLRLKCTLKGDLKCRWNICYLIFQELISFSSPSAFSSSMSGTTVVNKGLRHVSFHHQQPKCFVFVMVVCDYPHLVAATWPCTYLSRQRSVILRNDKRFLFCYRKLSSADALTGDDCNIDIVITDVLVIMCRCDWRDLGSYVVLSRV